MSNRARNREIIHLRRYSRAGYLVVACKGQPIREGNTYQFANRPEGATCPDCVRRAQKEAASPSLIVQRG